MKRRRRARRSVGAATHVIEKRDPIPPGVYWLDLPVPSARTNFELWRAANAGVVELLKRQQSFEDPWDSTVVTNVWVLFKVKAPVGRWPLSAKLGLPTIAFKGEQTADTDISKDTRESVWDYWERTMGEFKKNASEALQVGSGLGLVLLIAMMALSSKNRR